MIKKITYSYIALILISLFGLISCEDKVELNNVDSEKYRLNETNIATILDKDGKRDFSIIKFTNSATNSFYLNLTKTVKTDFKAIFEVDTELLKKYNADNNSSIELLPKDAYDLNLEVTVQKGKKKSSPANLNLKTIDALDSDKMYALPLKVKTSSNEININTKNNEFILFVKDLSKLSDAAKSNGIKIISCTGINPLNHLGFTLKNSNKLLIDMVIMFSAGMKIDPESGRIYLYCGGKFNDYLQNSDKYIKPLRDRGIKVLISILGAREACGVSNLNDETAKEFAQELNRFCKAYNLDGVFFDDEYSNYVSPPPAGYVSPSRAAASRLCYETKKAMPDKLVTVYGWSNTRSLVEIDGHQPGEYIDYAIVDYGNGPYGLENDYKGLPKSGMSIYSQEFAQSRFAREYGLQTIVNDGYGANMIFSLNPFYHNWGAQKDALKRIAKVLYNDELVIWDESNFE